MLISSGLVKEELLTTETTQPWRETTALNNRYQKGQREREKRSLSSFESHKNDAEKKRRCYVCRNELPISSGSFRTLFWIQLLDIFPGKGSRAFASHRWIGLQLKLKPRHCYETGCYRTLLLGGNYGASASLFSCAVNAGKECRKCKSVVD